MTVTNSGNYQQAVDGSAMHGQQQTTAASTHHTGPIQAAAIAAMMGGGGAAAGHQGQTRQQATISKSL